MRIQGDYEINGSIQKNLPHNFLRKIWYGTRATFFYPAFPEKTVLLTTLHSYLNFV